MKRLTLAAVSAMTFAMTAGAASAATLGLTEIFTGQGDKLFTTEIKRDQNIDDGARRGHDIFLRNGDSDRGSSGGFVWDDDTPNIYNWSLSYDGGQAVLTLDDGGSRSIDVDIDVAPDGDWNAFQLFVRADDADWFETASTTVTVDEINSMTVSLEAIGSLADGAFDKAFVLAGSSISDLAIIRTISGTLAFDFDPFDDAKGSPNSRLGFNLKAFYVEDPAVVPIPGAIPLLLSGLAGLGLVARRRKKA